MSPRSAPQSTTKDLLLITLYHGTSSKRGSRICGNERSIRQGFKFSLNDCVYFAEDIPTAKFFASEKASDAAATQIESGNPDMLPKNICIIEFKIPKELSITLEVSDADRLPLGQHTGMAFPDIANGGGFERILIGEVNVKKFNEAFIDGHIQHRRLKYLR